jgi:hypothetical protein
MKNLARFTILVALTVLSFSACSNPNGHKDPEVQITVQNFTMKTGESQILTVSGGDGVQYVWSLNTTAGTLVPASDKKSAVLTAGANAGNYIVTVHSGDQSGTVSIPVLTMITPADNFKYVRPAGSITNPSQSGSPAVGFSVYYNYTSQNSVRVSCPGASWNGTDTLSCPELAGIPQGNHLVYVADIARIVFVNGIAVDGSQIVGNNFFLSGQMLNWGPGCPVSFPPAARCAYFSR